MYMSLRGKTRVGGVHKRHTLFVARVPHPFPDEPVEQNRHKQTGLEWSSTRAACMHSCCRQHQLFLAALPLFCDRCKKALIQVGEEVLCGHDFHKARDGNLEGCMLTCGFGLSCIVQAPQQRVYYQETLEAAEAAGSSTCIRLCNACITSLRSELKSGGPKSLYEETLKFTREHQVLA